MRRNRAFWCYASAVCALLTLLSLTSLTFAQGSPQIDPQTGADELPNAAPKVIKRLNDSLQKFYEGTDDIGQKAKKIGEGAGRFIDENGTTQTYNIGSDGEYQYDGPMRHPFADGKDPQATQEYVEDSKAALNNETFSGCFEEKEVVKETNPEFTTPCDKNCPEFVRLKPIFSGRCEECKPGPLEPDCYRQHHYVSEYYFPMYETRIFPGRAMGSFDVEGSYLSGPDKRSDLSLASTKQKAMTGQAYQQQVKDVLTRALGQEAEEFLNDPETFPDYQWYNPSLDWMAHDGVQPADGTPYSFHELTYQTNVHRVATRLQPQGRISRIMGYRLENKCFWQTLDDPSKEVIAAASYGDAEGNKNYPLLSMFAQETRNLPEGEGEEAARQTLLPGGENMYQVVEKIEPTSWGLPYEFSNLIPSLRMSEWGEGKNNSSWMQDLQKVGVYPKNLHPRDYVYYGLSLAPFNAAHYNAFHDPLYAAIGNGVSFYFVASLPGGNPKRRALWYTRYLGRHGSHSGYTATGTEIQDDLVFTDKFSMVYPPLKEGSPRKGTHCIRPENISRVEAQNDDDSSIHTKDGNWYNISHTLRTRFPLEGKKAMNQAQEVRLIFWEKRVACYCELCGRTQGCWTLNDGDMKEDNFYGTKPFVGPTARTRSTARSISTDSSIAPSLTAVGAKSFDTDNTTSRLSDSTGGLVANAGDAANLLAMGATFGTGLGGLFNNLGGGLNPLAALGGAIPGIGPGLNPLGGLGNNNLNPLGGVVPNFGGMNPGMPGFINALLTLGMSPAFAAAWKDTQKAAVNPAPVGQAMPGLILRYPGLDTGLHGSLPGLSPQIPRIPQVPLPQMFNLQWLLQLIMACLQSLGGGGGARVRADDLATLQLYRVAPLEAASGMSKLVAEPLEKVFACRGSNCSYGLAGNMSPAMPEKERVSRRIACAAVDAAKGLYNCSTPLEAQGSSRTARTADEKNRMAYTTSGCANGMCGMDAPVANGFVNNFDIVSYGPGGMTDLNPGMWGNQPFANNPLGNVLGGGAGGLGQGLPGGGMGGLGGLGALGGLGGGMGGGGMACLMLPLSMLGGIGGQIGSIVGLSTLGGLAFLQGLGNLGNGALLGGLLNNPMGMMALLQGGLGGLGGLNGVGLGFLSAFAGLNILQTLGNGGLQALLSNPMGLLALTGGLAGLGGANGALLGVLGGVGGLSMLQSLGQGGLQGLLSNPMGLMMLSGGLAGIGGAGGVMQGLMAGMSGINALAAISNGGLQGLMSNPMAMMMLAGSMGQAGSYVGMGLGAASLLGTAAGTGLGIGNGALLQAITQNPASMALMTQFIISAAQGGGSVNPANFTNPYSYNSNINSYTYPSSNNPSVNPYNYNLPVNPVNVTPTLNNTNNYNVPANPYNVAPAITTANSSNNSIGNLFDAASAGSAIAPTIGGTLAGTSAAGTYSRSASNSTPANALARSERSRFFSEAPNSGPKQNFSKSSRVRARAPAIRSKPRVARSPQTEREELEATKF